ncbi:MAG: hypothetical protein H7039_01040 [Bryobacteraceae bacterium]|nr:hypothetical protein [Bryobacteraceae bacterium]
MIRKLLSWADNLLNGKTEPAPIVNLQRPAKAAVAPLPKFLIEKSAPSAAPRPVLAATPGPAPDSGRRGRPVSDSLTRTIKLLASNEELTPAELAKVLKVTSSYARTLLRRARLRSGEETSETATSQVIKTGPRPALPPAPVAVEPVQTVVSGDMLATVLDRLEAAEGEIQSLRSSRPATRATWSNSRRAEVIHRSTKGQTVEQIASDLVVPSGEVRFILKVHRLMVAAH